MAQYEDEKKSEAEMKKSYQATLIPKEQGEESETESKEIELTSEEPEKEAEGAISNLMPEESEKEAEGAISNLMPGEPEDEGPEPERSGVTCLLYTSPS